MSFCLGMYCVLFFAGIAVLIMHCEGLPLPETVNEFTNGTKKNIASEVRAGNSSGSGGLSSIMNNFQSGVSTLLDASNMKESKLIMGGFSIFIIPGADLKQLAQLGPGMISQLPQLPSLPGGK